MTDLLLSEQLEHEVKNLASNLRQFREDRGVGIRTAARLAGVSAATLSRIENGRIPDVHTLILILKWMVK